MPASASRSRPGDGLDLDQLLKNADLALYGAKGDGRRTYRFFEAGMDARAKARRSLELELRQAIADGGLEVYYQPVVNLEDGKVSLLRGAAALAPPRTRHDLAGGVHSGRGRDRPDQPARQLGAPRGVRRGGELAGARSASRSTSRRSSSRARRWRSTWPRHLPPRGLPPHRLELEITEAVLIRDDEAALEVLHQLRKLGVRIALDDFGTGYSSLSYLQRFPFDKIKIDRSFIKDLAGAGASSSIVQAVVNIAAASDMTTTAEGVETEQQRNLLYILGCTEMQGFLFSPAIPAVEIRRLLLSHRGRAVSAA